MKRLRCLLLAVPLLMGLFVLSSGQKAFAATRSATTTPQKTIVWVGSYGQIVRVWTGSESAALVIEKNELAYLAKLHAEHPLTIKPAAGFVSPNINRVSDGSCAADNGTVFFKLWNSQSGSANGVCFANAGDAYINVYAVYAITTGNNEGNFAFTLNPYPGTTFYSPGNGYQWCKQVTIYPATYDGYFDDVTKVGITSPSAACQG